MKYGRMISVVAVLVAVVLAGAASATSFSSNATGAWSTNLNGARANTWGTGTPTPPVKGTTYPWSDNSTYFDVATINPGHTVTINGYTGWGGEGSPAPTGLTIILDGGGLNQYNINGVNAGVDIQSWIRVKADSTLSCSTTNTAMTISGKVTDFDGVTKGNLVLAASAIVNITGTNNGNRSGFSGNWILGSGSKIVSGYNSNPGTGSQIFGTGTLEFNGGTIQFSTNPGTIANPILLGASGGTIQSHGTYGGIAVILGGAISGSGKLTLNESNGTVTLTNGGSTYGSLDKTGAGLATIQKLGGLGTNTNAYTVRVTSAGILALDDPANATAWIVQKNLGGIGTIQVEGGSGLLTASGNAVRPGNSVGTLTIAGNLVLSNNASLEMEIMSSTSRDVLTVNGTVNVSGGSLNIVPLQDPLDPAFGNYISILNNNDGTPLDPITGKFLNDVAGKVLFQWDNNGTLVDYVASITYQGQYGTTNITGGNDIILYDFAFAPALVPEPAALSLLGLALLVVRRRRS